MLGMLAVATDAPQTASPVARLMLAACPMLVDLQIQSTMSFCGELYTCSVARFAFTHLLACQTACCASPAVVSAPTSVTRSG